MTTDGEAPLACALTGSAYADRLAWIAVLNRDGLRGWRQYGPSIELEYALPEGSDAVQETRKCVEYCRAALNAPPTTASR